MSREIRFAVQGCCWRATAMASVPFGRRFANLLGPILAENGSTCKAFLPRPVKIGSDCWIDGRLGHLPSILGRLIDKFRLRELPTEHPCQKRCSDPLQSTIITNYSSSPRTRTTCLYDGPTANHSLPGITANTSSTNKGSYRRDYST